MNRIKVATPLVELDGDEMTRVIWQMIRDKLILPFLDIALDYYDLHVQMRDATDDRITHEAALAIKRYGVGVKCATITPDKQRIEEFSLKRAWPSPNATIRSILDGTVFRRPIIMRNIHPGVRSWEKPIVIGRHAYGDIYSAVECLVPGPGKVELLYQSTAGETRRLTVHEFAGPGMVMAMHNLDSSVRSFARACINYALAERMDLWFCAKDTISKVYHGKFREIVEQCCEENANAFRDAGIEHKFFLIDDAAAQLMKHSGGMLLALMNYDGDVWSDLIAGGFGSLGLMTSVLVSPEGHYEYEAAHGTVRRHFHLHKEGKRTSTNPVASIFAWSGALTKRAELDHTPALEDFAAKLEQAVCAVIESGRMTQDLVRIAEGQSQALDTEEFIDAVAVKQRELLAQG